ncbi:MAG: glycosyltransferase family 39 protein [Bacteroidota bacterium]
MRLKNNFLLLTILLVATILRFWNYSEIPFTNDEFSALFRTHYDSFSDLISKGVIIDGHPAGIQVFIYYWVQLFGYTEMSVKFPFIIFGILSILVLYRIAKMWYNETIALICASFLATLQYTVVYSQIARPYISGLLFCLLMVLFLTRIIKEKGKKRYWNYILFVLSASLCTYNHHFSLLFALIIGVSGLFLIQKKQFLPYFLCGLAIIVLYLPHLPIFFYQLKVGGVEGWLGKPKNDFIISYLKYIFQFSYFTFSLVFSLMIFGIFRRKTLNKKNFIIAVIWFFLPFLIGFFYSKYVNSVLQYSVLIFNFPFLFFILFGHIQEQKTKINAFLVGIILLSNTLVLCLERKHYETFYKSPQEHFILELKKIENKKTTLSIIADYNRKISNHYIKKHRVKSKITWIDSFKTQQDFILFLETNSSKYDELYFGGLSEVNPSIVPLIMDYFPEIVWQKNYFGGTAYLFLSADKAGSKGKKSSCKMIEKLDFESKTNNWSSLNPKQYTDSVKFAGKYAYLIDSLTEWSPTFSKNVWDFAKNKNNIVDVSLKTCLPDTLIDAILIVSLEAKDSAYYWGGSSFETFKIESKTSIARNKWISVHHSFKLSQDFLKVEDLKLKVFIWNRGKQNFLVDNIEIKLRDGNPIIYGFNEKF